LVAVMIIARWLAVTGRHRMAGVKFFCGMTLLLHSAHGGFAGACFETY
jgi:hypothetical protein